MIERKVLLIDGEWNLKRNFKKRQSMFAKGEHCGGSFGALESIRTVINRVMPDRVVVCWDGSMSGIFRKDIYPLYKANRDKSWDVELYEYTDEEIEDEQKNKYSQIQQKIKVKNYLEELCIRQVEADKVEADDLIALYVKRKKIDEEIIIFSSDKDFYQLIGDNVSVLRPSDYKLITKNTFKEEFGYTVDNALFVKCMDGDTSDNIPGVKGLTINQLGKYFPHFLEEKYTLDRLISEAEGEYLKKPLKVFEKIIGCREMMERNGKLMNLKRPLVTQTAIDEIEEAIECAIIEEDDNDNRSIKSAINMMVSDGFEQHVFERNLELFFRPFYRLISKEKEYTKMLFGKLKK